MLIFADMEGKSNQNRTVIEPAAMKTYIDQWLKAAGIDSGRIFAL